MVVRIDGVKKFQTSTVWDNESPSFDELFTSELIAKDSNIQIEMWDDDAGDSENDLMSRWKNIAVRGGRLLVDRENKVQIYANWM